MKVHCCSYSFIAVSWKARGSASGAKVFLLLAVVPPRQWRCLLEAVCTVQDVGWVIHGVTGFVTICNTWTDIRDFVGGGLLF